MFCLATEKCSFRFFQVIKVLEDALYLLPDEGFVFEAKEPKIATKVLVKKQDAKLKKIHVSFVTFRVACWILRKTPSVSIVRCDR